MMMQVLFLSKGILTADDALTTNQKTEKESADNMLILTLKQHTHKDSWSFNKPYGSKNEKKFFFAFALRVMKLPISTHANSHHSFEKATESTVCGPASFILL